MLRKKFADRSKLVVSESSGHGAYVLSDSACVQNLTTAYLVDGRMPAKDVTCRRS
ncbi:alpha/beta hydrolase [Paractinoplanes lichenicola]|uniref:Alpha/beta hydrolase n=1 Tax=Paractinoplanes lichenicola TaxID=2802976 RepID=A0ABS1W066_9ACTN|nr:alpha/beta hydrolase [Actinoplanes lichenicola]